MSSWSAHSPAWNKIQGNWKQFAGRVRQQWGLLTDDDVIEINGEREKLVGKLQERYGVSQEAANRQIDAWADALKS
jgi:uncharacterized protein YjbJ (UPF0337 family)